MVIVKPLVGSFVVVLLLAFAVYAEVDCQINTGPCIKQIPHDRVQITFDINPKPVKFMEELTFRITLIQDAKPIGDAKVTMDLTMPGMFMGKNSPVIKHVKEGVYEGKGVIPRCPSGRKVWRAAVSIERGGKTASVDFTFEGK
jgi:hypothetical protein